jgi:hypothetical protein
MRRTTAGFVTGEPGADRTVPGRPRQAGAVGFGKIDAAPGSGADEHRPVLPLAAVHGAPVRPHAGGVGPGGPTR